MYIICMIVLFVLGRGNASMHVCSYMIGEYDSGCTYEEVHIHV